MKETPEKPEEAGWMGSICFMKETPEPERGSSCVPWIGIPDGTIAVVMTSGAFDGYAPPGFY